MKIDIQTFVIKFSKDNENLDRVQGSEVRPLVLDLTLQVLNASFIVLHITKHEKTCSPFREVEHTSV